MRSGRLLAAVSVAALSACVSACSATEPESGRKLDGPLVANVIQGGQTLVAPKAETWWASFGQLEVCTEGPEVTIDDVRLVGDDEALELRKYVFRGESGYQGVLGAAPGWEQPYATITDPSAVAGTYDEVPGAVITETCDAGGKGRGPAVVPVIKTDRRGLSSDGLWVDYTAEGDAYSLKLPWEIVLCGTEQTSDVC